jgi:hypothetical protein
VPLLGGLFEGEPEDAGLDGFHCGEGAAFGDRESDCAGECGLAGFGIACEDAAVAEGEEAVDKECGLAFEPGDVVKEAIEADYIVGFLVWK